MESIEGLLLTERSPCALPAELVCMRPYLPLVPQSKIMSSRHKALFSAETLAAKPNNHNIRATGSLVLMQGLERREGKITEKALAPLCTCMRSKTAKQRSPFCSTSA